MMDMTKDIFGKLYGDKGYISKAMADILWGNGVQMVTKPRKNMKGINLSQTDKIMLRKRAIIECVSMMNLKTFVSYNIQDIGL